MMAERQDRSNRFQQPQWLLLTASAILLSGAGFVVWRTLIYQSDVSKGTAALAEAFSRQRPLEARMSGLPYAPASATRGDHDLVNRIPLELAERLLLDAIFESPGSASHYGLGKFYLAQQKYDEAISQFEEALKTDPNNAQIHNDYGAALLEKGKAARTKGELGRGLGHLAKGFEQFDQALDLNPSLLEALFNRALCLQHMNLTQQAADAWKKYLEKDSDSKWAEESQQNLVSSIEPKSQPAQSREQLFQDFLNAYKAKDDIRAWNILNQSRDLPGNLIENQLLDDYLALVTAGRSLEAVEKFDVLVYASGLEYSHSRDRFMPSVVSFYKSMTSSQQKNTVEARGSLKKGYEKFYQNDLEQARKSFNEAKESFKRAGNYHEAIYTEYVIGESYLRQLNTQAGQAVLQSIVQSCEQFQYKRLLVLILGSLARVNQDLRDFSTAIGNTTRALKLSEEMGDTFGYEVSTSQLADEYRFINNGQKALDLHAQALSLALTYFPNRVQRWRHYFSISLTLEQLNLYAAAIAFQREALQIALDGERLRLACRSYNHLGQMLARQGGYVEAAKNIERALELGNTFSDKSVQKDIKAYSFLHLGYVYRRSRAFDKAIENYDRAIEIYDEVGAPFFNYMVWKDKLLCCLEQDVCPTFEQELERLLNLFEQHRAKILEESNRNTFFDAEQNIYDIAIEFEYSKKGNRQKAFDYSERSRARSLRDLISTSVKVINDRENPDILFGGVSQALGVGEIQARMPEQAQILQYSILKDNLLIWVVSGNSFFSTSVRISAEDLNNKVRNYLELVSGQGLNREDQTSSEAAYLYDLLIRPVEGALDKSKQLCIVPDKILNYLPFGALKISGADSKYFIEAQGFVLSPSSNVFILCSESAVQHGGVKNERLLSVGNPIFDRETFPYLADLRSAAREAQVITGYYDSPSLIIEKSATENIVKSEMEKANVIHLAMHAIADEWNPMRSKLLLAKDGTGPDSNGVLQANEIYNLNLERARLVVLSACQTAVERYYGGEGMIGLARPFIAKRIPLVVASLWPVDTNYTARLMMRFHYNRRTLKMTTAEALRASQIEMLRDADNKNSLPYNWASFATIGGYAGF